MLNQYHALLTSVCITSTNWASVESRRPDTGWSLKNGAAGSKAAIDEDKYKNLIHRCERPIHTNREQHAIIDTAHRLPLDSIWDPVKWDFLAISLLAYRLVWMVSVTPMLTVLVADIVYSSRVYFTAWCEYALNMLFKNWMQPPLIRRPSW